MRELDAKKITEAVRKLCIEANSFLPEDLRDRIEEFYREETWPMARGILEQVRENYKIAENQHQPICQDTGMACVFLKIGQEIYAQQYAKAQQCCGKEYLSFVISQRSRPCNSQNGSGDVEQCCNAGTDFFQRTGKLLKQNLQKRAF